jgi:hypothetical protein
MSTQKNTHCGGGKRIDFTTASIDFTTAALEMGEEGRLIADMDRGINAQ